MATDILIRIKKDGNYLGMAGDSQSKVDKSDELTKDFTPGKFVEIDDFDFGVSLIDRDSADDDREDDGDGGTGNSGRKGKKAKDGKFVKFTQGASLTAGPGQPIYPVTFDEVSITRQMDSASPLLLQSCFNTRSLNQVTVVKRKVAGSGATLGRIPYLRIDFDDVLITDLSWDVNDQVMKEKLKFVYRTVTVKYRPQNNDGSPGVVINAGPLSLVKTAGA